MRGVEATREEVQGMLDEAQGRSTTPDVEPPPVEALTPPRAEGDDLAGLENLDPEIVALLKADMAAKKNGGESVTLFQDVDEYSP